MQRKGGLRLPQPTRAAGEREERVMSDGPPSDQGKRTNLGRGLATLFGEANEDYASLDKVRSTKTVPISSDEHTSELQSLMRISYAVFCLKKQNTTDHNVSHILNR